MPDALCRMSIKAGDGSAKGAVDLALPADVQVGLLMSSIVDIVFAETATQSRRWRLSRIGGYPVDESMTLLENGVRDGELLLLAVADPPAPQWSADDPFQSAASFTDLAHEPTTHSTAVVACVYSAGCGAAALVGSQLADRHAHAVVAAAIAVSAMVAAVVIRRAHADSTACVALSVVSVVFSAAAGFLAVPDGPQDGSVLLAAACAFAAAILLLRFTGCGTVPLTAIATVAGLLAAAAGGRIWISTTATGVAMSVVSVAGLGISAKLSISIAGLAAAMPRSDEASSTVDVSGAQTAFAHHCLTGIVIGLSCAAPLGTALMAWGDLQNGSRWPVLAAFAATVGLVLLMRTATHADRRRRIALGAGGTASITVALAVLVTASPAHAMWASVAATAAGVSALARFFDVTISPVARRAAEMVEYAALAGVVPLACWAGDLYALVRETSLI
ncbi:type VII secretion integral membrane protein EccD [Mycobacterium sp. URHB0021]